MSFQQSPPNLRNQYEADRVLRSYLARVLPSAMLNEIEPSLRDMGQLAAGTLYQMQLADRLNEPTLTRWDAWGNRVDRVEVTALWREAERIAVEFGLVAIPYERKHGNLSRVHQCALAYLFTPSTDIYSCPLAMTDGAARTLLNSKNQNLIDRAIPHLITRNPADFWTAGQWMTEITGGSDVGLSQTVAIKSPGGNRVSTNFQNITRSVHGFSEAQPNNQHPEFDGWRLHGTKWFASAITSQMALTLARPEGNPPGGRGLALFYIETRDGEGRLRNIQIERLKDKLGTRKVPTAELTLTGTPAELVKGSTDGVKNITPLLNITRLWNGISAVALMRRGVALAVDYSGRRSAFGAPLSEKPLHIDTLAGLQAETEAAFHLAFYVAELTGRAENDDRSGCDSDRVSMPPDSATNVQGPMFEAALLRLLTPVMKLTTGKQAVAVLSEVIEAFGGAGYVEDTGLPQLLRDAQVLPIWEGTTNVLSLDTLRALGTAGSAGIKALTAAESLPAAAQVDEALSNTQGVVNNQALGLHLSDSFQAYKSAVTDCLRDARDPDLKDAAQTVVRAMGQAERWLEQTTDNMRLEAGARRFAMTLGRTMELALLIKQAQWSRDHELGADMMGRPRRDAPIAAVRRFANSGIDLLADHLPEDARELTTDH
jgi:acyl-CoA dehydrogenase